MSDVENTSQREPIEHLAGAMVQGSEGYITGMESAGQAQLVNSTKLPTDLRSPREDFEALGFAFADPDAGDSMFCDGTLPDGWAREGSDHAMWSYIVDEQGFRRASIFYKAAFYDRSAFMSIIRDPETKAQADSYEAFSEWCPYPAWEAGSHKDGDNLVRRGKQRELDDDGKAQYDHEANGWKLTGVVRERVIAPDGSMLSEREFTEA